MNPQIIAFYLPQFHRTKENDEWWGKGFTEWTNVTKARPRFPGHYQPHLPSDTGFYDLRLPEAREMQAAMAKEYGIYGFCYYHYWFNGKRLMERPVDEIISSGKPDFPFMICWANENWARNWDGGFKHLLMEQQYTDEDDAAHMNFLCSHIFSDRRYIRVNGKPFFAIYKAHLLPNAEKTIKIWREVAQKHQMELYLALFEHTGYNIPEYLSKGFDMSINFQPFCMGKFQHCKMLFNITLSKLLNRKITMLHSYKKYVKYRIKTPLPSYRQFPCVTPNFDNASRRMHKGFTAFIGSTPQLYGKWLSSVFEKFKPYSQEENFIFINAWNEWAEGNHLEPDQKWGRKYLEETKKNIDQYKKR